MDHWNDYLTEHLAGPRDPAGGDDTVPAPACAAPLDAAQLAAGFVAVIDGLGLIGVDGDDAASFLHNQLTNDVLHLGTGEARLAGYCSPKGRLQASMLAWRSPETVFLLLPRELQASLQKRLSMFVMRAKARLRDAGEGVVTLGVGGAGAEAALREVLGVLPGGPYGKNDSDAGTVIRVADAFGAPRFLWLTTASAARAAIDGLRARLAFGGDQAWALSSIHAGVPLITVKTQDQFVPQMVNFELLGGVNFKKGCYPGQEIVARSQYLGKLKRRTALASIGAQAQAGDEVFADSDPGQPCGMIVNAQPNGNGDGVDVLVELKLAVLDGAAVHLGAPGGPVLRFLTMPYPLDAIEV
ncbi:YgfZ/GcvT domain-containing protein [Massilia sp. DWR3-1-1]|uniref:CAF17-like 4Fe-4S cluster assembly/insertion protein YgfZ n=1 Tax=Massilia sp. DWR3-1-1 TaxID=2804559 RepID=UPI003CF6B755